jgi:hypothetical protein
MGNAMTWPKGNFIGIECAELFKKRVSADDIVVCGLGSVAAYKAGRSGRADATAIWQ